MDDIYTMSDGLIQSRIGQKLKSARLKQNITQESLAHDADISLSSLKKIEAGQIGNFETLLRCLRSLGELELILPMVEEEKMSPSEYYKLQSSVKRNARKRASGQVKSTEKEESQW